MKFSFLKHRMIIFGVLLLFVFLLNSVSPQIRGFTYSFVSPVQEFFWSFGTKLSTFLSATSQGSFAVLQLRDLEEENLRLQQEIFSLQGVKEENARFRETLEIAQKEDFQLVFAKITGKDISEDILFLNKGSADGLARGMPVITQSKVAVGSIGEVFSHASTLRLLSHLDQSVDAKIGEREIVGVLKGKGGSRTVLDLIVQEKEFQIGDIITTSSLGGVFPENLLVGKIGETRKSDVAAFQQGEVELFFDLRSAYSLFVITNY
tara:strand:+ start:1128 stop:1916 length:789 start_codon:yes stop_codon:yes gene_type:complete